MAENTEIEGVYMDYIDNDRLAILSTLPNLKYLQISSSRQEDMPDLSPLKTLDVLVLANMTKLRDIECVKRLSNLKTLLLYGINKLYDLTPLSNLASLQELSIHHGKTSSKGHPVNSMEPLGKLTELKYLEFHLTVEDNNKDISVLFNLKKLQHVGLMEKYHKKGQWELLHQKLPLLRDF
ncbi:MAG: leucine-rich repeat domain-containing protein [Prevotellaceae bacterium]|nr:leucine-rich repeat domain-containing protein [Prevotellaceae bacterium]